MGAPAGGGAPESAPACSLSSVNQNNDCAAGSPRARPGTVSSRRLQSCGRRSLGRAVSTPDSGVSSADPAQPPQPARSRRAPALQPLLGNRALCRRRRGDYKAETPGPALAMWIPTEHEKYGVGKSPRGELLFLSAGVAVHFASLPPRPSRSARQEMPNPGFELRVWGFAEPAPGRGVRVGVSLLRTRLALPARVPGARGQLRGARGQPARCGLCLRSLEWRRGVCVKLEGERKRRSSRSSPSPQRQQWAAKISQAWERPQPRGEVAPETEGSANPSL